MDVDIKMPDLATADSDVTLLRWLIDVGQPVKLGQALVEIETDKATMEVESIAAGTLKAIHAQPGERVAVGQLIAVVEKMGASAVPTHNAPTPPPVSSPPPVISQPDTPLPTDVAAPAQSSVSLFARNKAARVQPTHDTIPLTGVQRDTALRLQNSKQTVPHFYLTTSANAEPMAARRAQASQRLVWDAFLVYAVAKAAQAFPRMQYRFDGDKLVKRGANAIGVAVDVEDNLYVVPIDNPLSQTIEQISAQITSKAERIRQGDPTAKKLGETHITITNLGAEGIESFQAIINPPEAAILAVGAIAPTVHVTPDYHMVIQKRVSLSLSVDHRVVSGKYAAKFLSQVVKELESM